MENATRLIAERLHMARTNADKTAAEMAAAAGVTEQEYLRLEQGDSDYSFTFLYKCATALGMDIAELVSGEDPKLRFYNINRKGDGMPIKRRAGFNYRHIAPMLKNRAAEPFIVTAKYDISEQEQPIRCSTHKGQEFDYIISGQLKIRLGDHTEVLSEGDSVYYDSSHPHGMIAVGGTDCVFMAIVFKSAGESELDIEPVAIDEQQAIVRERESVYDDLIYHDFCTETKDAEGRLVGFDINPPADFNFAFDVVDRLAVKCGSKTAMVWVDDDMTEKRFTFRDISRESSKAASFFKDLGIKKGDRVMLVLKRRYQFWFAMLGLHKLGAIAIPATDQLVQKDFEYRFNAAGVSAIVCTYDGESSSEAAKAAANCDTMKYLIIAGGKKDGFISFDDGIANASETFERKDTSKDDPLLMFFTSGTTGYPKIALHKATYPLGHIITARYWQHVDPNGLHLTTSDTGWGKALWGKLYGQWLCESAIFVYNYERFSAAKMLPMFAKYGITTFCAPPTIYRFLIKEDLSQYNFSSLKHAATAGEALNPEVLVRFYEATGLTITEGFGQTETTMTIGNLYGEPIKPGSMGKPSPAYNVMLLREDGSECAVGETGEIAIDASKDPCGLFDCYYRSPEQTVAVKHDGIYRTGDTAWCDEDGYYWFVGRADDVIKSSGYRIGPFEIESVIMELPYVLECAVIGVPDDVRGQVVKAFIVLTKGKTGDDATVKEIQNYVKSHTAPYKYPRKVCFVESLPKTISGKIIRTALKNM